MKVVALAVLALGSAFGYQDVRKNFAGDKVVDIHLDHLENAVDLLNFHEGDTLGREHSTVSIKLSPEGVDALEKEGITFIDTTESWIAELQANFDDPDTFCWDGANACAGRDLQSFYSSYQDYDAIMTRWKSAVLSSPLASFKTIGVSSEGRNIEIAEIGDASKPLAYIMCTIHAREWLPSMYCPYLVENLLADGGHRLLDTFSFAVIPVGNPDGFVHTKTSNNMWRKTRNSNPGSSCVGTDPNRNYGDHHCQKGTSNNPCSDIYCGPAPFSTPETEAVNNYAKTVQDRLITWIDVHSYGSMWLSPLGYDRGTPPAVDYNRMFKCMTAAKNAVRAATGTNFVVGGAADVLGAAAGASDDYFYFAFDVIYSFTVEMRGRSFQPSSSNILPANVEIFAAMVAQMDCIEETELAAKDEFLAFSSPEGVRFAGVAILAAGLLALFAYEIKSRNGKKSEVEEKGGVQVTSL